jgi:hypothetical protein
MRGREGSAAGVGRAACGVMGRLAGAGGMMAGPEPDSWADC